MQWKLLGAGLLACSIGLVANSSASAKPLQQRLDTGFHHVSGDANPCDDGDPVFPNYHMPCDTKVVLQAPPQDAVFHAKVSFFDNCKTDGGPSPSTLIWRYITEAYQDTSCNVDDGESTMCEFDVPAGKELTIILLCRGKGDNPKTKEDPGCGYQLVAVPPGTSKR